MQHFNAPSWAASHATAVIVSCAAWAAVGCTAQVQPVSASIVTDEEVVVDATPVNIYSYPHTEYRGSTVYYAEGRWYRPRGNRWYYYHREPADLVRHRQYIQAAPPARPYGGGPPGEAERVR